MWCLAGTFLRRTRPRWTVQPVHVPPDLLQQDDTTDNQWNPFPFCQCLKAIVSGRLARLNGLDVAEAPADPGGQASFNSRFGTRSSKLTTQDNHQLRFRVIYVSYSRVWTICFLKAPEGTINSATPPSQCAGSVTLHQDARAEPNSAVACLGLGLLGQGPLPASGVGSSAWAKAPWRASLISVPL